MDLINVNDFKPGITFLKDNSVFLVLEALHAKSGRGQAHVRVKAKNLSNKSTIIFTFVGGEKIERAFIERHEMQFLYSDEKNAYFMDNETFDQAAISLSTLEKERNFLVESLKIIVLFFNGEILDLELPKNISLKVTSTADAVKGDTVNKATKKAILETGLEIDVPQFINLGDKIIVNFDTEKYISKNSEGK